MAIKDMADIKDKLAQGKFRMLQLGGVSSWLNQIFRDEQGATMIAELRAGDALSDLELFSWLTKEFKAQAKRPQGDPADRAVSEVITELQAHGELDDFANVFNLLERVKTSPELLNNRDKLSSVLIGLADIERDGTLIRNISDVKQHLAAQNFAYLKANHVSQLLDDLSDEDAWLSMLEQLRLHDAITDLDVYQQIDTGMAVIDLESVPYSGSTGAIFDLLQKCPRDGSLVIDDSEKIWHQANDYSLPLIKALVNVGAQLDHNAFLANTFAGDNNAEYGLFDFLIAHYKDFSQQALISVCACVFDASPRDSDEEAAKDVKVIQTALAKIDSIDTVFDQRIRWARWHSDDYSLFGALFRHKPEWLVSLPEIGADYIPSSAAMEEMDWDFVVCEGDFGGRHLETLKILLSRGADLPVEEIIEALDDNDKDEYASELRATVS